MLIVVEGCIGAGKSTVANGLAACRNSKLLLEDFERNPFLRAFCKDPIGNATETEFAFLLVHYHQVKGEFGEAPESEVVADFHIGKDLLYADLNLKDVRANILFRQLYEFCVEKLPPPSVMVFLSVSTDLVVERIRARRRDYELQIEPGYFATLNAMYEDYFLQYTGEKLRLPMEEWDFVKNPGLYAKLDFLVNEDLNRK